MPSSRSTSISCASARGGRRVQGQGAASRPRRRCSSTASASAAIGRPRAMRWSHERARIGGSEQHHARRDAGAAERAARGRPVPSAGSCPNKAATIIDISRIGATRLIGAPALSAPQHEDVAERRQQPDRRSRSRSQCPRIAARASARIAGDHRQQAAEKRQRVRRPVEQHRRDAERLDAVAIDDGVAGDQRRRSRCPSATPGARIGAGRRCARWPPGRDQRGCRRTHRRQVPNRPPHTRPLAQDHDRRRAPPASGPLPRAIG